MKNLRVIAISFALCGIAGVSFAQDVRLHVNPRWKECSFQLDPSLTQSAWHEFTKEAGLVAYFRPLTDAKPLGKWKFEFSLLKWSTAINSKKSAWNDTFVHPDSTHWLVEGPRLGIPGLTARVGVTDKMDVALYWTKSPGANYGFWGGQLQYSLINNAEKNRSVATRVNFVSIYGPEDLKFNIYGLDVLASKEYKVYSTWASVAPYFGLSTYVSHAHETSAVVDLHDETVIGVQGMIGVLAKLSKARVGAEYNFAKVSTVSIKIGVAF
jgi:hypothetical protein